MMMVDARQGFGEPIGYRELTEDDKKYAKRLEKAFLKELKKL